MKKYQRQSVQLIAINLSSYSGAADFSDLEFLGKSSAKNVAPRVHAANL